MLSKLEVEAKYDENGKMVFFMQLWKKQQEGTPFETKCGFNPSRDDLALLAGKVEPENFDSTAREESEEDVEK